MKLDVTCNTPEFVSVVYNGRIFDNVTYQFIGNYTIRFNIDNNIVEVCDYDDRLDVYYHMSDDGSIYYTELRVLDENDIKEVPPNDEIFDNFKNNFQTMVGLSMMNQIHTDDLNFSKNILRSEVWLHREWQLNNKDIDKAQKSIIKKYWNV